jgi:hypothetical protein
MDIEADVQPSDFGEVSADLGEIHIHLKETFESGAAEEKEAFTHVLTLEEQHEEVENALRLSARLETEEDEAAKNEEDEALSKRSRRAHRRRRRNEKGGQPSLPWRSKLRQLLSSTTAAACRSRLKAWSSRVPRSWWKPCQCLLLGKKL